MTLSPATIRFNRAASVSELVPRALYDPTDIAIVTSTLTGWWPGERGMMEGVAAGSALPFRWKSYKDLQRFSPAVSTTPPIMAHDAVIAKDYLQFGYGGALARRTNTLRTARLNAGGTGHAVGNVVTFTGGVQITIPNGGVTGGVITSSGVVITNYGAFASQPTAVLTQTGTTGSGTGASLLAEFATDNGSIALTPTSAIVPTATSIFSLIAAFRCPVVNGVAGADPGGFIAGAELNQGEVYAPNANVRWWGLRLGSAQWGAGKLIGHIAGDGKYVVSPSAADFRDGQWHVAMLTFLPGAGSNTCRLWVDGVNLAGHTGGAFTGINTTSGTDALRIGASGLPADGPTGGAALDVGEVMVVPLDLSDAANETLRKTIVNKLLATWRLGGTSQ